MENMKSNYEITVDLLKAMLWPTTALVLIFFLWSPIKETTELLPSLLKNSESIEIGGISIKTGSKSLIALADKESIKALDGISLEAMSILVGHSRGVRLPNDWKTNSAFDKEPILELVNRELYFLGKIDPPLPKGTIFGPKGPPIEEIKRTTLGKKVTRLLQGLLLELSA